MPSFTSERINDIIQINVPMEKNSQFEQWVFVISDQHWDSTHCDREMMKRDLDLVVKRDAIVLSVGDFFDLVSGRGDPRRSKSEIRPEHKKSDYLSCVLEDASEYLKKYAGHFGVICHGNHETAIIKNCEYDPTKHLVGMLNAHGGNIIQGEYEEFVRLSFIPPRNSKVKDIKWSKLFYLNHGWGGASPVTGGTIHNHRAAEFVRADFVCMGHLHTSQIDERTWWDVTNRGRVQEKNMTFLRTAGYKQSRMPGKTTWETVKGIKPKPRGGIWLRFHWDTTRREHGLLCDIVKSA